MEYRLNKVDIELRQRIEDQTKDGKVHGKQEIDIGKDKRKEDLQWDTEDKSKKEEEINFDISKYKGKNKNIEIKVYKTENIEVNAEREEKYSKGSLKGLLLDVRK